MRSILLAAAVVCLASAPADAYLRWPWQQPYRHHYRAHPPAPNCEQINAAAKTLPPDRYERALRSATKAEQKIIADCAVQP
jgi:hypothetical protein